MVVSLASPAAGIDLLWVLMITSAANKGWAGDISLEQRFEECGLKVSCLIRTAKITTVEARRARVEGALPADLLTEVRRSLIARFG